MKLIGARSVASLLITLMRIARYTVAVVFIAMVGVIVFALAGKVRSLDMTVVPPSLGVDSPAHDHWFIAIPVSLALDQAPISAPSLGIERAEIQDLRGSLRFPIQRGLFFIVNACLLLFGVAVAFWILTELQRVLQTVRDGHPFVAANATRVRRIAWVVIAGELVRATIVYAENAYAAAHFSGEGLRFYARPDLSVGAVIEGLIILVIAEVFRAGTKLDEEQSLTV